MSNDDDGRDVRTGPGPISVRVRVSRRRDRLLVLAFALLTMMLGTWGAWSWSLIPLDVHGRVDKVEYQSKSEYRWRVLELDDGRLFVIDRRITAQLGDWQKLGGQRVDTDAGSHTLRVGRNTAHLAPSVEFWKILFTFAALAIFAVARVRLGAAPRSSAK